MGNKDLLMFDDLEQLFNFFYEGTFYITSDNKRLVGVTQSFVCYYESRNVAKEVYNFATKDSSD